MIWFRLFFEFFKIGLFTFGGGYAMIPLIKEAVLKYGWLSEDLFYDFIGVCESTPGPIAVNFATFVGAFIGVVSVIVAIVYLILKLVYWNRFAAGMAPLIILVCFLGAMQLIFIGLMGEYILSMNKRLMNRPLVVEEERLNFEEEK